MKKLFLTLLFSVTFLTTVFSYDVLSWKPYDVDFIPSWYHVYQENVPDDWYDYNVGTNTSWVVIKPVPNARYNYQVAAVRDDGWEQMLQPNDIKYTVNVTNSPSNLSKVTGLEVVNVVKLD